MRNFRVTFDFTKSQPRWNASHKAQFGENNEGFIISGIDGKAAFDAWNAEQLPGARLNAFYVKITEV